MGFSLFRYVSALLRAMTPSPGVAPIRVVTSSVTPSAKYSSSGLPRLVKGSTTIRGAWLTDAGDGRGFPRVNAHTAAAAISAAPAALATPRAAVQNFRPGWPRTVTVLGAVSDS